MTLHHISDTKDILNKFYNLLEPSGYLLVADLAKEDGSFHTDGTTDVHKGFAQDELQKQVESAGFLSVAFSTVYEIKKIINGEEKTFPVFLMSARKI